MSEEDEQRVTFNRDAETGKYIIVFDPLDGSSNIDVNVNVGTIFSVAEAAFGTGNAGGVDSAAGVQAGGGGVCGVWAVDGVGLYDGAWSVWIYA